MIKFKHQLFLAALMMVMACGKADKLPVLEQQQYNPVLEPIPFEDVQLFDYSDNTHFASLPLEGDARNGRNFWSGDYWPLKRGNINYRWNTENPQGTDLLSPSRDEVFHMTPEELAQLSPAEKFDLLMGRYDYPLKQEVESRILPDAADWEGICNGWAAASSNHVEPTPKVLVSPDYVSIPFGSADIKALLSYYYAYHHQVITTHQIGKRCERRNGWFNNNPDCKNDVNAGSFHLALSNTIGVKKKSFLMDVERYREVWNHPVVAYTSRIVDENRPGRNATPGTEKVLKLITRVYYVDESVKNTWDPILETEEQKVSHRDYAYLLYINGKGQVIGGAWKSGERPDFLWRMGNTYYFQGILKELSLLI